VSEFLNGTSAHKSYFSLADLTNGRAYAVVSRPSVVAVCNVYCG